MCVKQTGVSCVLGVALLGYVKIVAEAHPQSVSSERGDETDVALGSAGSFSPPEKPPHTLRTTSFSEPPPPQFNPTDAAAAVAAVPEGSPWQPMAAASSSRFAAH